MRSNSVRQVGFEVEGPNMALTSPAITNRRKAKVELKLTFDRAIANKEHVGPLHCPSQTSDSETSLAIRLIPISRSVSESA